MDYKKKLKKFKKLKPLNAVIQICPICNKVDVYKNDGHRCGLQNPNNNYVSW